MFRLIKDVIRLIKDAILFILKIGWKILVIVAIFAAIIFGVKSFLHI